MDAGDADQLTVCLVLGNAYERRTRLIRARRSLGGSVKKRQGAERFAAQAPSCDCLDGFMPNRLAAGQDPVQITVITPGHLASLVERKQVQPAVVEQFPDTRVTFEGIGLGVLPPIVVKDELESGRLVEAHQLPGIVETFFAVTLARRFPNPLLPELLPTG